MIFEKLNRNDYFYIDKTMFIKERWENGGAVGKSRYDRKILL